MAFIMLRYIPFVPTWMKAFIPNEVEFCQMLFSVSMGDDYVLFILPFVNVVYDIDFFKC